MGMRGEALGSNGSGQLGITHKEDVSVPKPSQFEPPLPPSFAISRIAAGGNHTLVLLQSGELYWSGDPSPGACGLTGSVSNPSQSIFRPVKLTGEGSVLPEGTITDVAATWEASVILRREGDKTVVYTLGSGPKGELGLGGLPAEILRTPTATLIPSFPPEGTKVVGLSACMSHVVAVLDNGDVYGWGNGRKGQLGEPAEVVKTPRKISPVNFPVKRAVTGREFTCLVSSPETGEILVLGSDKWGVRSSAPTHVRDWKDVQASWGNVYVLNDGGRLLSWGRDDHGQMVPPELPKVSKLAVGSEHVVCLSGDGDVLSWGWGEHGNCGPTADTDVKGRWNVVASSKFIPEGLKITGVGAGCATSWVIITAG
ncbi:related to alpha-tubulin suppressor [Cephalotrichum gorgonifer]|uniref:Related to alpha-tubulin suppressor n=1 Tax=Cephalotrichum gorgonifer TaxID=2041049 RepID=A0AAE8MZX8_9PEZI|nr:related to alpha-tubulin suppressor [Cephalotrichum gorgonifer]